MNQTLILAIIGWVLAAILQTILFAFYFGRLTQEVRNVKENLTRLQNRLDNESVFRTAALVPGKSR